MKIGIDIDDTITDLQEDLFYAALEYDKTLRNSGVIYPERHYIAQRFDWSEEEKEHYLGEIRWKVLSKAKIRDGALEVLNILKEEGHEIIFITARCERYYKNPYEETYDFLKKNEIPFDKLIINALDKGQVCLEEKIDVFIDDQEKNCILTKERGIKTIYFDIEHKEENKNFITAYSWYDILNKIREI